jgi:hypothetical protein
VAHKRKSYIEYIYAWQKWILRKTI